MTFWPIRDWKATYLVYIFHSSLLCSSMTSSSISTFHLYKMEYQRFTIACCAYIWRHKFWSTNVMNLNELQSPQYLKYSSLHMPLSSPILWFLLPLVGCLFVKCNLMSENIIKFTIILCRFKSLSSIWRWLSVCSTTHVSSIWYFDFQNIFFVC